jgi:transcriptional regulator with XRE-family HTH domain
MLDKGIKGDIMVDRSVDGHGDPTAADQLAAELRGLRKASGQSLRELEKSTHASDSSLSRYLSGQALPPWPVVAALATVAGRDTEPLHTLWVAARQARNQTPPPQPAKHTDPAQPQQPARQDQPAHQPPAEPPPSPATRGPRRARWRTVAALAAGIGIGAAIQPIVNLVSNTMFTDTADTLTSSPYFTVDLLATPPGSAQRAFWTDTAPCGSAYEYRLTYDLPPTARNRAMAYRVEHADCTVKLFDGLSGNGYGEILVADNRVHDLSPRIIGTGVSVVAYSCCNGTVLPT